MDFWKPSCGHMSLEPANQALGMLPEMVICVETLSNTCSCARLDYDRIAEAAERVVQFLGVAHGRPGLGGHLRDGRGIERAGFSA